MRVLLIDQFGEMGGAQQVLLAAVLATHGRPIIFHAHSIVSQESAAMIARWALRSSRVSILASSRFAGQWTRRHVQVIYNGVAGFGSSPRPRREFTSIGVL